MDDTGILERSPLSRLSKREYDRHTTINVRTVTVGVGGARIASENSNRVALTVHNPSAVDMYLSPRPDVLPATGIILSANGGTLMLNYAEDGEGVGYELWAINALGNNPLTIWETVVI